MPAVLIRIATWLMTSIAGQVLFSLGLGVLSFTSLMTLLNWITYHIELYFTQSSKNILIFVDILGIDYYMSVLISAIIIKTTIMSAQVALAKRT